MTIEDINRIAKEYYDLENKMSLDDFFKSKNLYPYLNISDICLIDGAVARIKRERGTT
jgi:hypothetical protein